MLYPGLYKQIITKKFKADLSGIQDVRKSVVPIDKVEVSRVLAKYLIDVIHQEMDLFTQINLANQLSI